LSATEQRAPGAPPPEDFVPLIVPEIRGNEWAYVKECLDTNWVSSVGSYVERFERMIAERARARFAVATTNGTAALHIALLLAGVEQNDEVLVSSLTFIAPANTIRYVGAWPVFIDADPSYWQIDPQRIADFLEHDCVWQKGSLIRKGTGRRIRAILPVHILGHPADLGAIQQIAERYALPVIEDATEGLGAEYRNRSLGGIGDVGCFSFNGNKIITTGGGGMLVTNRQDWAERARYLTTQAKDDPIEYVHGTVGYNYRLTNLLAAMGCAQMENLDAYIEAKRSIAARYHEALDCIPGITTPSEAEWASSTYWMYTIRIDERQTGIDARAMLRALHAKKIQTRPLWQPMHLSPAHSFNQHPSCPVAEALHGSALSLPCSVGLSEADQDRVIDAFREIIETHAAR
jgi:perosamine synthetase